MSWAGPRQLTQKLAAATPARKSAAGDLIEQRPIAPDDRVAGLDVRTRLHGGASACDLFPDGRPQNEASPGGGCASRPRQAWPA